MTALAVLPRSDRSLRALSVVGLLIVWQVAAMLAQSRLLPSPTAVALSIYDHLVYGDMLFQLGITLWRVAASFVLAMAIGGTIGILMGRYRGTDRLLDIWLVLGLNLPALVVIFLCYVWLGLTEPAAILAVAVNKIPMVVVTLREGARAVDRELLDVARVLRLSRWRRLRKVYLPQLYPYWMAATRNGLALIWKIVLIVELIGRSNGVGFKMQVYFEYFDITSILAYTFAFIAVVMAVEVFIVRPLERRATRWRP